MQRDACSVVAINICDQVCYNMLLSLEIHVSID
jgi:hypothetical protein